MEQACVRPCGPSVCQSTHAHSIGQGQQQFIYKRNYYISKYFIYLKFFSILQPFSFLNI